MKEGFRQSMAWLHTWSGLVVGWVLFFVFVTGTVGYFSAEVSRWMRPELPMSWAVTMSTEDALNKAQHYLKTHAANAQSWDIKLPGGRYQPQLEVSWRERSSERSQRGRTQQVTLDPVHGTAMSLPEVRATGGGQLLYRMHYALHYMPIDVAIRIVGACTMLMLLAICTGVITHKKIFKDFFTFRRGKGQRSWLDAHNIISVASLPFFLMITYSGFVFFLSQYMPAGLYASYGMSQDGRQKYNSELALTNRTRATGQAATLVPLAEVARQAEDQWRREKAGAVVVRHPGDRAAVINVYGRREGGGVIVPTAVFSGTTGEPLPQGTPGSSRLTQSALLELHQGYFADPWLRWLYFAVSLMGCAMIATGLVLWTVKRRQKQDKRLRSGQSVEFGFRLVETLNIGTIAGLCTAVAVYFWANRLIPTGFSGRAAWEAHAMFIAWGALLLHAAVRLRIAASRQVWQEQLWIAAAAFGLLPALNYLTTDRHLGVTLPAGDWVLASFDLTALGLGLVFAAAACKIHRKAAATTSAHVDPVALGHERQARA
ncbi:MAG: PepSY domain-containing protein [Comamonadaceae bacterium]|nr:PepSY domain-containing protein [Comamonadaceae bacterium]